MLRISVSTNAFFFMFRDTCALKSVLADCAWTNSSGDCVPSPSEAWRHVGSPATDARDQIAAGICLRASRKVFPCVALIHPPVARLTRAMGSPLEVTLRHFHARASPQRRIGRCSISRIFDERSLIIDRW
jgi:hypothetical protein